MTSTDRDAFGRLAQDLKAAADKDLTKALYKRLYDASFPIQDAATQGAGASLPKGGGMAVRKTRLRKTGTVFIDTGNYAHGIPGGGHPFVTRERIRLKSTRPPESLAQRVVQAKWSVKGGGGKRSPSIRLTARGRAGHPIDLRTLDAGRVNHPVFATGPRGTWKWASQSVPQGWFSNPVAEHKDDVRDACMKAVEDVTELLRSKGE